MADELVHRDTADGVATITLDSPRNRNALSSQVRRELQGHLDTAITAPAVRCAPDPHRRLFCSAWTCASRRRRRRSARRQRFPLILTRSDLPDAVVARLAGPAGPAAFGRCRLRPGRGRRHRDVRVHEVRIGVGAAVIAVTVLPRLLPRAAHRALPHRRGLRAARAAAIGFDQPPVRLRTAGRRGRAGTPTCFGRRSGRAGRPRRCYNRLDDDAWRRRRSPQCRSCRPATSRRSRARGHGGVRGEAPTAWVQRP